MMLLVTWEMRQNADKWNLNSLRAAEKVADG